MFMPSTLGRSLLRLGLEKREEEPSELRLGIISKRLAVRGIDLVRAEPPTIPLQKKVEDERRYGLIISDILRGNSHIMPGSYF